MSATLNRNCRNFTSRPCGRAAEDGEDGDQAPLTPPTPFPLKNVECIAQLELPEFGFNITADPLRLRQVGALMKI